jgi:hypothetical protein
MRWAFTVLKPPDEYGEEIKGLAAEPGRLDREPGKDGSLRLETAVATALRLGCLIERLGYS